MHDNPFDVSEWNEDFDPDDYIDEKFRQFERTNHSFNLMQANPEPRLQEMDEDQRKQVLDTISNLQKKEALQGALGVAKTAGLGVAAGAAILSQATRVTNLGSFNGNILQYSPGKPSVTITRKKQYNPNNLGKFIGRPSNESVILGNLEGYTKVQSCHLEIKGATQSELNKIESLLKEGVIL